MDAQVLALLLEEFEKALSELKFGNVWCVRQVC